MIRSGHVVCAFWWHDLWRHMTYLPLTLFSLYPSLQTKYKLTMETNWCERNRLPEYDISVMFSVSNLSLLVTHWLKPSPRTTTTTTTTTTPNWPRQTRVVWWYCGCPRYGRTLWRPQRSSCNRREFDSGCEPTRWSDSQPAARCETRGRPTHLQPANITVDFINTWSLIILCTCIRQGGGGAGLWRCVNYWLVIYLFYKFGLKIIHLYMSWHGL